jgi:hypothetical protein
VRAIRNGWPLPVVITAAHCLPRIPPPHPARHPEERTFEKLLGPLGAKPTVWTECLFADLMADLAILGQPAHPDLYEECDAYKSMMNEVPPLEIADAPPECRKVQVLSLDGKWEIRTLTHWIEYGVKVDGGFISGMSGSPILSMDGKAIAVVSTDIWSPPLSDTLPAWFFRRRLNRRNGFRQVPVDH